MTDKLQSAKGYVLLDCMIALSVLSVLTTLAFRMNFLVDESYLSFYDAITVAKSEAMALQETVSYIDPYEKVSKEIVFYPSGSVNQARTVYFNGKGKEHAVVVELGTGILEEKE